MAASLTKYVPTKFNLIFAQSKTRRLMCGCHSIQSISQRVSQVPDRTTRPHRHLFTHSHLRQSDIIKPKTDAVEPTTGEDDVLYKKIMMEMKGHDREVLRSYEEFVKLAANHLDVTVTRISKPKVDFYRQSLLKSVHIFKKHRVQYEQRTHFLVFEFSKLTGSTADTFLEYAQRNLPEGVAMKVTRHQLEHIPDHLKPPKNTDTIPDTL